MGFSAVVVCSVVLSRAVEPSLTRQMWVLSDFISHMKKPSHYSNRIDMQISKEKPMDSLENLSAAAVVSLVQE